MDELVIGDKKYISSKLAAKATGYAKDYVGQLCREGRVPARLVGRSWYVLESAIQDHRFGEQNKESIIVESPRYEAVTAEVPPPVPLNKTKGPLVEEKVEESIEEAPQRLQETWQAWFDRFDNSAINSETVEREVIAEEPVVVEIQPEEPEEVHEVEEVMSEESEIEIEPEISVPIHTVYRDLEVQSPVRKGSGGMVRTIKMTGVVLAAALTIIAVLGSGYLDSYILSNSQARIIAGIGLYNK